MPDFWFFLEVLVGGLLSGTMYALVALGFVLIYKASSVFNLAQGAMVLIGRPGRHCSDQEAIREATREATREETR